MEKTTNNTIIEPMCGRVLVRKDEDKGVTKGGIVLPDSVKIPTITARIVAIAADVEADITIPLYIYDKVIVDPSGAIPVELESDNKLFIIPVTDVVARFATEEQ